MSKDSEKGRYTTPDGVATWEYASVACCAVLIFCSGCVPAWITPTLNILMKPGSPIPATEEDGSNMASAVAAGFMTGPIVTILIVDRIGRKNSLLVGTIPLIVACGMTVIAKDVTVLILSRFLGGITMSLTLSIVPMFLGEIATVKLRGAMGMICSTMMNCGTVFMFVVGPHVSIETMASICLSIILVSALVIRFIPESPYFLAMRNRCEEAELSLEKLRGKTDVTEELELIKATLRQNDKVTEVGENKKINTISGLKLLFTVPANRRSLWINILHSLALSWGSSNVFGTYCTIILGAMKAPLSPNASMLMVGLFQFGSNILTIFVVERCGRRPLLCISGAVSGTCLLIVSVYFYLLEYTEIDVTSYSIYPVCVVFINLIAVGTGLMPLQIVIQSETIATEVKAVSTSVITTIAGLLTSISLKFYILLAITLKFGHCVPFFVFTIITWFCTFFVLKLLPETKGKTFLEIQNSLGK